MDIIASLYSALSADAALVALIEEFEGAPAIFSGSTPPIGHATKEAPNCRIGPIVDDEAEDDFSTRQRRIGVRIRFYALATASDAAIDEAATRARDLLHRARLPATGTDPQRPRASVSGPVPCATSAPEITGRQLTVWALVKG
jgi:hypothetical protein